MPQYNKYGDRPNQNAPKNPSNSTRMNAPNQMNVAKKRKREDGDASTRPRTNGTPGSNKRPSNLAVPPRADEPIKNKGKESLLTEKHRALLQTRSQLPIWSHASEIRLSLHDRDVLLLVGETGSGKSTQVPQFLMGESWCKGCIAITQPRRVAAISLARRVAEEMGTPLGTASPASKVGYSVRFDNNVSPSTKIKFLTEGMLLQEMLRDPQLTQYSAVIVDEVHERGVNVDLILGFLRNLVTGDKKGRKGAPLKTIVMSATADTEALFMFFEEGFGGKTEASQPTPKASLKVTAVAETHDTPDAETESSWSGLSSSEEEAKPEMPSKEHVKSPAIAQPDKMKALASLSKAHGKLKVSKDKEIGSTTSDNKVASKNPPVPQTQDTIIAVYSEYISTCFIKGRQHPVEVLYTPEASHDFADTALKTIFQIHYKEPLPGDILVFLTGQETIEYALRLVNELAAAMGPEVPKILALPLYAALPQAAQQTVFHATPRNTRKVILSTNIAETSVTIPGIRFVIDCGMAKVKEYRSQLGMDSLLVKPISKSAAIQRKGRAGREAPGKCYRLYTEPEYLKLETANIPEILRCDLASSFLTMKARGVDDVLNFPLLDRPKLEGSRRALLQLLRLGALNEDGRISKTGLQMAKLPLSPSLARVLIAAAQPDHNCVLPMIDIVSALNVENMFLNVNTEEKQEEVQEARRDLLRREGDHLTLMTAVQAYAGEHTDRRAWADRHFVSHRAMQSVMDVRKQLRAQCIQQNLLPTSANSDEQEAYTEELGKRLLKCLMTGFAANTARLMPDRSYRTIEGNQIVAIHPSSVLFGKKVEAIMYNELVFTQKSYARGVSAVQLQWYAEAVGE